MDIILNQVAIWKPCGSTTLNKRYAPAGASFRKPGEMVYRRANSTIVRYAKDYSVGRGKNIVKFCLFFRTDKEDDALAESELDQFASKITHEYAKTAVQDATTVHFEYTPHIFTPKEKTTEEDAL